MGGVGGWHLWFRAFFRDRVLAATLCWHFYSHFLSTCFASILLISLPLSVALFDFHFLLTSTSVACPTRPRPVPPLPLPSSPTRPLTGPLDGRRRRGRHARDRQARVDHAPRRHAGRRQGGVARRRAVRLCVRFRAFGRPPFEDSLAARRGKETATARSILCLRFIDDDFVLSAAVSVSVSASASFSASASVFACPVSHIKFELQTPPHFLYSFFQFLSSSFLFQVIQHGSLKCVENEGMPKAANAFFKGHLVFRFRFVSTSTKHKTHTLRIRVRVSGDSFNC
jgi:hypothetical protein